MDLGIAVSLQHDKPHLIKTSKIKDGEGMSVYSCYDPSDNNLLPDQSTLLIITWRGKTYDVLVFNEYKKYIFALLNLDQPLAVKDA